MPKLLREYNAFEGEIIKEEKDSNGKSGKLIMKGVIQRAGALNQNGRIYPLPVLEREMRNYQKLIRERRALGALDHTDSSIIELKTVSHIITEAYLDNGIVYGKLEILPTDNGNILRNLIESNVTIGISSRGVGSTQSDAQGHQIVQDDFQLICYDVVSEPSTAGAFLMREARELTEDQIKDLKSFFNQSDRIDRIVNEILGWNKN